MSLKTTIAGAVAAAFNVLSKGGLVVSATITHYTGAPVRNMTTGAYTRTSVSYIEPQAIKAEYSEFEGRANILQGDMKLLVQQSKVVAAAPDDLVTIDSIVYTVITVTPDPADATFELQIREKSR